MAKTWAFLTKNATVPKDNLATAFSRCIDLYQVEGLFASLTWRDFWSCLSLYDKQMTLEFASDSAFWSLEPAHRR